MLTACVGTVGATAPAHIRAWKRNPIPEADRNLILYRSKDGLGVRYEGEYVVAGQSAQGRTGLPMPGSVAADAISFTVEPAGKR